MTFSAKVKEELEKTREESRRKRPSSSASNKKRDEEARRSYLRELFLSGGTVSDPKKSYHLEINCGADGTAEHAACLLAEAGINVKLHRRGEDRCLYLKDADDIADMLNYLGAPQAMMELENARILHDISGSVNRQVNCETANQNKTIVASMAQLRTIEILEKNKALKTLPPELYELAMLRRENIDVPLKDLGAMLKTPLGKSGTYHRFRRIEKIAEELEQK